MKRQSARRQRVIEKPVSEWASFARNLNIRILATGQAIFAANEGTIPKSVSRFWSIYVPDGKGLILGQGKGAVDIAAGFVGLVPPGVSAAREARQSFGCAYIHFDVGGYTGEQLLSNITKVHAISSEPFKEQLAIVEKALLKENSLRAEISANGLLSVILSEVLSNNKTSRKMLPATHKSVLQIDPVLQAIDTRLYSAVYHPLKVQEMSALCGIRTNAFPRFFHEVVGKNPTEYAQERRIDVAVQQLLFTKKSIDEISSDLSFANRFYFSRVFKEEVGQSPAAYRDAFRMDTDN